MEPFCNALTASLSGLLGYYYGIIPVFIIMSVMALLSIIFTMAVKKEHIDYDRARGAHNNEESIPLKDLLKCMPLLAFGLVLMAFAALFVFIFSYKFVKGFAVK